MHRKLSCSFQFLLQICNLLKTCPWSVGRKGGLQLQDVALLVSTGRGPHWVTGPYPAAESPDTLKMTAPVNGGVSASDSCLTMTRERKSSCLISSMTHYKQTEDRLTVSYQSLSLRPRTEGESDWKSQVSCWSEGFLPHCGRGGFWGECYWFLKPYQWLHSEP